MPRAPAPQSVISYTIANLEEQLNVALLDRSKRKPTLTEAGKALLADARAVSLKVDGMRARAKALSAGLEAEVSLVVDVMFSTCKLVRILHAFQKEFPTVAMRLRTEALGAVTQLVMDGTCHIGISGWMPGAGRDRAPGLRLRHHGAGGGARPSAGADRGIVPTEVLREHTQLVLTDRSTLTAGQDFGVLALRDWRLGDLSSKHALLRNGIGWGNMPLEFVQWDLDAGRLVQLQIPEGSAFSFPLYVIRRGDEQPGPATRWLMQQFLELVKPGAEAHGDGAQSLAAHGDPVRLCRHSGRRCRGRQAGAQIRARPSRPAGRAGRDGGGCAYLTPAALSLPRRRRISSDRSTTSAATSSLASKVRSTWHRRRARTRSALLKRQPPLCAGASCNRMPVRTLHHPVGLHGARLRQFLQRQRGLVDQHCRYDCLSHLHPPARGLNAISRAMVWYSSRLRSLLRAAAPLPATGINRRLPCRDAAPRRRSLRPLCDPAGTVTLTPCRTAWSPRSRRPAPAPTAPPAPSGRRRGRRGGSAVGAELDFQVQVARPGRARLALPRQPQLLAGRHALGNVDAEVALARDDAVLRGARIRLTVRVAPW
jgi:DNA-binding transcriptional LysR family regulator